MVALSYKWTMVPLRPSGIRGRRNSFKVLIYESAVWFPSRIAHCDFLLAKIARLIITEPTSKARWFISSLCIFSSHASDTWVHPDDPSTTLFITKCHISPLRITAVVSFYPINSVCTKTFSLPRYSPNLSVLYVWCCL